MRSSVAHDFLIRELRAAASFLESQLNAGETDPTIGVDRLSREMLPIVREMTGKGHRGRVREAVKRARKGVFPDPPWQAAWASFLDDVLISAGYPGESGRTTVRPADVPKAMLDDSGQATSRDARAQLLEANEESILVSCAGLVVECTDPWVQDVAPLTIEVLAAWLAGYEAAATTLAVCVADPLVIWAAEIRHLDLYDDEASYEKARSLAEHEKKRKRYPRAVRRSELTDDPSPYLVPNLAVLAPIGSFLTRWWPGDDDPPPESLSRHVVAH